MFIYMYIVICIKNILGIGFNFLFLNILMIFFIGILLLFLEKVELFWCVKMLFLNILKFLLFFWLFVFIIFLCEDMVIKI